MKEGDEDAPEFANIRSISHLKALLKNYRTLTESQEALLDANLKLSTKIPTPDEIVTPESRFRLITDSEIQEMRDRLAQSKATMEKDQLEIENRRKYVQDLARKLDEDKVRLAAQREEYSTAKARLKVDDKIEIIKDQEDIENQAPENQQVRY